MSPAPKTEKTTESKRAAVAPPAVVVSKVNPFKRWLVRTGNSFTAEYVMCLIALGIVLSNLAALVYIFCGLIVDAMNGGIMHAYFPSHMFTLWLTISSLVALPVAVVLWRRVQGELTLNADTKGDVPKGAARGFRTFWMVLNGLSSLGLLMAGLYAPLVSLIAGAGIVEAFLSMTLPSFVGVAINVAGLYIVTRNVNASGKVRTLLWIVGGLTVALFTVNYLWASNLSGQASTTTRPYTEPSNNYDVYDDLYDDTYYDYNSPTNYR